MSEALVGVQVLIQTYRDVNCDVYACLIDYEKAFDRVQHHKIINILEDDVKGIRIFLNLQWNQTASKRNIAHVYINGTRMEQVQPYNYLGTVINEQWDTA